MWLVSGWLCFTLNGHVLFANTLPSRGALPPDFTPTTEAVRETRHAEAMTRNFTLKSPSATACLFYGTISTGKDVRNTEQLIDYGRILISMG